MDKITNPGLDSGIDKAKVGLANVDNTSDVNKPISAATQTELDLKATLVQLDGKSDIGHNHDTRYYTETEIDANIYSRSQSDAMLAGKSDIGHNHDTRYYTETEIDNIVATNKLYENDFINGYFDIWQRGNSFTSSQFTADRWKQTLGVNDTSTVTKMEFALGQTDVPGNQKYYMDVHVQGDSGTDGYINLYHRVLNASNWSSKRVCVVFWAKSPESLAITLEGFAGDTASGLLGDTYTPQKVQLSPIWTKYTVFIDFPNLSSLSLTNPNFAGIQFWLSAGTDFDVKAANLGTQDGYIQLAACQAYVASAESETRRRTIGEELISCQKYFSKSYNQQDTPGSISPYGIGNFTMSPIPSNIFNFHMSQTFPVEFLYHPAVTFYSRITGQLGMIRDEFNAIDINATLWTNGQRTISFYINTAIESSGLSISWHWTAEAEI